MGRPVKIRASYVQDAQYLVRIAQAVERDTERSSDWRREALHHLEELTALFMKTRMSDDARKAG